jgi:hypothetical protein
MAALTSGVNMTQQTLPLALLLSLGVAACGGGAADDQADDDGPDGGVDDRRGTAVVVSGDFVSTGILSTIAAPGLTVTTGAVAGVTGADPAIRRLGDELFVINRFGTGGDTITILDARTLALVDQISTGAGSNPQDVAVVGDKLYVAALGSASILVIDRNDPTTIDTIDLSALDVHDGMPDCISVLAVGDRVYAACGLLQDFAAVVNGAVAVIDPATDTLETTVELPEKNPSGWLVATDAAGGFDGDILLGTVDYGDYTAGCLVRITPGATPTASCGPRNETLGGYVNRLVFDQERVWAVVDHFDESFNATGWVVRFDGDGVASAPMTAETVVAQDLAICGWHVFVTDKATDADGVRVYNLGSFTEETDDVLDVGLPPGFGNATACAVL